MKNLTFIACLLALALVLTTHPAQAQVSACSVAGTVQSPAGAALPGTTVTLENVATGQRMTATADSAGHYQFDNIPAGRYRMMTSTAAGMTAPTREFDVQSGMVNTVNLTVSTGTPTAGNAAAAAAAVVTAEPVNLSHDTSQIRVDYNTLYNRQMPQSNFMTPQGNNYGGYNLTTLSPAVTAGGIGEGSGPATAGVYPAFNNWRVDGMDNTNKLAPGTPLVYVSPQATQEVALFQNQFTPLFGHSVGGKSGLIAGGGTNGFHGSVYDFLQNRNLNALDQSWRSVGVTELPRYDQNRLGATFGFPIKPNKVFMLGNFEYIPFGFNRLSVPLAFAPTPAGFAQLSTIPGVSATNLEVLQSAVGSVGPESRTTTVAGQTIPLGPVNSLVKGFQNSYLGTGVGDINFNEKNQLRARYVHNKIDDSAASVSLPAFAQPLSHDALLASLAYYYTSGAALTNELRLGYTRWDQEVQPNAFNFPGLSGFPALNINGGQNLFVGPQGLLDRTGIINTYHLSDAVGYNWRGHNVRIGFDGLRTIGFRNVPGNFTANFAFSNLERFLLDLPPDVFGAETFGSPRYNGNQYLLFGFVQDSWRARPNLTINLGIRYEYDTVPWQLSQNQVTAVVPSLNGAQYTTPRVDTANFTPNVGFAWSPNRSIMNRNFVVRGGFGMAYAGLYGSDLFQGGFPSPQFGAIVQNDLQSNQPGFFANGGLQPPAGVISTGTPVNIVGRQIVPYTMNWNFAFQTSLWSSANFEAKYLGTRGVHMPVLQLANRVSPVTAQQSLPVFLQQPTTDQINSLSLTLGQLLAMGNTSRGTLGVFGPLATFAPEGNTWYHGLALRFNQRFAGGFQMLTNYTWSHMIDDASGTVFDLASPTRSKASSLYDRRHRVAVSGVLDVAPLFKNTYSVVRNILANMTLAGTYTFQSSQFLPVSSGIDTGLIGSGFGSGVIINNNGASRTGSGVSPITNAAGATVGYLANNPNARFISGGPGAFTTTSRAALPLGITNNFDLSLTKGFAWRERAEFQIRGDAFNVFNHPQFTGGPINTLTYGSTQLLPAAPFLNPGNPDFNNANPFIGSNARLLQVALRVTF